MITELILDFGPLSRAVGAYLCLQNDPVVVLIDDDNLYHFEKLKRLASFVEWNDTQAYGLNGLRNMLISCLGIDANLVFSKGANQC